VKVRGCASAAIAAAGLCWTVDLMAG
jgi:hypothetical protein